jgi:PAS domain S-box-containing protein
VIEKPEKSMAPRKPPARLQSESAKANKKIRAARMKPARKGSDSGRKIESALDASAGFPDENPNPILRVAKGGRLLYANRAGAPLLKKWGTRMGGTLPPEWKRRIDKALSSLEPFSADEPVAKRIYAMDVVPIKDAGYANVYGRDITEARQAENIFRDNEERLKLLFELAPDAYYISDLSGNFVDGNKAAETLIGYNRDELIGKNFLTLNVLGQGQTQKASQLLVKNAMRKLTGPDELVLNRKDGSQVTVEIRTHPFTIHDKKMVLGIARDITERKRAETALRIKEERYRELFDNIRSGVAVYEVTDNGEDFIFVDTNKAGERLGGDRREDLIGKSVFQARPGIREFGLIDVFRRVWKTGEAEHFPAALYRDGGVSTWYENFVYRLPTGEIVAIYDDITERKQSEEAIRESEEKFRNYMERAPDGIFIVDDSGRYLEANESACRMTGYSKEEIERMSIRDLLAEESREDGLDHFRRMTETGAAESDLWYKRKDGANRCLNVNAVKLSGTRILEFCKDITENKRVEEELMESKSLIEAVVENMPLMIFLKEATDLRFVVFNRAGEELLGYDRKALLGRNNLDLFPPEQAAHFMAKDREVLDGEAGMLDIPEEPIQTAGRGQRLLHTRKVCIRGPDGTTKYLLGISEDITERKQTEDQLKSLLKEKEVLVKEVHHRVKNNFMVLSSLLGLQSQQIEDKNIQAMFMTSSDRIKSMSLIHERLYRSQDLTHIDFAEYIRTLADDLYESFGTDPGKVSLVIEAEELTLNLDQAIPCGLILNELLSNALKYGFPQDWKGEGRIAVTLRKVGEKEIELSVKDNGIGLPIDFDFQKTRSLGLKIVSLLAEDQLGGELTVDRNEGTGFRVRFNVLK